MAEAEEVVSDVARHATTFARDLWHRYRERRGIDAPLALADLKSRIGLLTTSVFGDRLAIRVAQAPAPPTMLGTLFGRRPIPVRRHPVPATDGATIWLPAELGIADRGIAVERYRTMALQQAMRAARGSSAAHPGDSALLQGELYSLLEAYSADEDLADLLPGMTTSIEALRRDALEARPPLADFREVACPVERFLRMLLESRCGEARLADYRAAAPDASLRRAADLAADLFPGGRKRRPSQESLLYRDRWTGDLLAPDAAAGPASTGAGAPEDTGDAAGPRTGRLARRPAIREAPEDEDEDERDNGAWMVQADEPHEKAEDPMGLQRPTDRDDEPDTGKLGDMLSELPEARLVSTPGRPKDILLSDDPPPSATYRAPDRHSGRESRTHYPEWDYRKQRYREPGATVVTLDPLYGPAEWVERTLEEHRSILDVIRRRFEMLEARRVVLRRQLDGEEIDLDACVDALADLRAGTRMPDGLYRRCRPAERDLAITLLIDASGSTDGWVSSNRRVIDVEREALLLVSIALREMREPYAIQAFSGEGPQGVTVRPIKSFEEQYDDHVARRIAALEPEQYTRAGAAIRHATGSLMHQPAAHRLLLLLSDGKPNDVDDYEGRYGVEDMRQAVIEARMQGIHTFCLTIDRQAADYLPRIFGANQYAMLPRSELLPTVLLDWMRRLLAVRQA